MAAEIQPSQATPTLPRSERKSKSRNSNNSYKKPKSLMKKSQKPTQKMQKLYRKRAMDYHSSSEEVPEESHTEPTTAGGPEDPTASSISDGEAAVAVDAQSDDELREDGPHQGMAKLAEGSRAFKLTFSMIMKKKLPNEPIGPVLLEHKSLIAEKLAKEATEYKAKAETKRLKQYNLFADKETDSYNFEGRYDLVRFIKTVQNAGLYAHICTGPYVCAKWNFGVLGVQGVPGLVKVCSGDQLQK